MLYPLLLLLFSSLCGVVSQILFKSSTLSLGAAPSGVREYAYFFVQLLVNPWFLFALVLYGVSFVLWIFLLSRNALSILYPIGFSMNLLFTVLLASVVFGETIEPLQMAGIGVIIVGMLLVLGYL